MGRKHVSRLLLLFVFITGILLCRNVYAETFGRTVIMGEYVEDSTVGKADSSYEFDLSGIFVVENRRTAGTLEVVYEDRSLLVDSDYWEIEVPIGGPVTFAVHTRAGYSVKRVTLDGVSLPLSSKGIYTVTMKHDFMTVSVTYGKDPDMKKSDLDVHISDKGHSDDSIPNASGDEGPDVSDDAPVGDASAADVVTSKGAASRNATGGFSEKSASDISFDITYTYLGDDKSGGTDKSAENKPMKDKTEAKPNVRMEGLDVFEEGGSSSEEIVHFPTSDTDLNIDSNTSSAKEGTESAAKAGDPTEDSKAEKTAISMERTVEVAKSGSAGSTAKSVAGKTMPGIRERTKSMDSDMPVVLCGCALLVLVGLYVRKKKL